ncbi:MAG: GNAT family N-acetyltransferase [Anaerolineaceae bacterium]|nr:GNAT family N-acetyltransferase [Anaerolineaceae bacterium]
MMDEAPNTLVTTYLEMTDPAQFRPAFSVDPAVTVRRAAMPDVMFYRTLYRGVGAAWRWRDRLLMSDAELAAALADPNCEVHVLYVADSPAGYVELVRTGHTVEIAYFGLFPAFLGRGLGKHLLSCGIERAWALGAKRVWLHTCNLDAPHALANYLKRGFQVFQIDEQPMPERYR